tara:strand:- start:16697 stop:16930 length:234 start_codon:yes stop_codon:yes gene_type:complete
MEYKISLNEEQVMCLIEMTEKHRCEGEEEICSNVRTSVKSQFKSQFQDKEQNIDIYVDDIIESAKKSAGPGYCEHCE